MEESAVPVEKSVHYAIVLHKTEQEEETLVETDVKEEIGNKDIEEEKETKGNNTNIFIKGNGKKEMESIEKGDININESEKKKKKNSIDLDYLDDEIFNITINMGGKKSVQANNEEDKKGEDEEEEEGGQRLSDISSEEEKEEEKNKRARRRSIGKEYQENKKRKRNNETKKESSNENSSKSSEESDGSADEVCKILKVHINDKPERKNRASYILQHKQRTKEKGKDKSKKNPKKNNEPRASFLKLNNNTRENNRRASVATNMLEKLSNLDNSDPENNDQFDSDESQQTLDIFGNSD